MSVKPKKKSLLTPEDLVRAAPAEFREVFQNLRDVIKKSLPQVTEIAYPGWRIIGYKIDSEFLPDKKGKCAKLYYLFYLGATKSKVVLGFQRGTALKDPRGILKGEGSQVRQLHFRKKSDIKAKIIKEYIGYSLEVALMSGAERARAAFNNTPG